MIFRSLVLFLISFSTMAAVSDQELRQKRKEITEACKLQAATEMAVVDRSFDGERDAIAKANLKMNDDMAKRIELGGRISNAQRPVIEKEEKCLLKLAPLEELSKKKPEDRVFPAGI